MSETDVEGAAVDRLGIDKACELDFFGFTDDAVSQLRGRLRSAGVKVHNVGFVVDCAEASAPSVTIQGLDKRNSRLLATTLSDSGLGSLVESDPVVILEPN